MTKSRFALLFPLLLLTAGSALCAATFDPRTMMDVGEVQRGAKAISRSVFAGTEITEFNLQIIDIMHQANLGSDMILARVLDGPVVSRQSGIIGCQLGRQAPLIPARIEVVDKSRNYTRTFNIKVMRHPGLTPLVLASGISSALEATFNPGYEGTIRTSFEIKGERGATLKRSNQYYVMGSPVGAGTAEVMDWMGLFEDNRWEPQEISGLVYRAEISDRDETVVIEKVFTEETVAKAGQPLHVHVLLRPDDGQLIERVLTVKMPLNLPKGSIRLGVSGGQDVMYFRGRFGVVMPEFDDLRTALRYVENLEQNKQLCVLVGLPTSGMTVGGTTLMNLPASVGAVLSKSSRTDVDSGKEELLAAEELPWVVYGRQMLSLAAEDRQGEKGAVTASPATPPAPAAPKEAGEASASSGGGLWWLASAFKTPRPGLQRPEVLAEGLDPVKPAKPASENKKKEPQADDGAAKLEDDDEEEDDAGDKKDEAVATVVRQPSLWTQSKGSEFAEGEATGLAVRKSGALLLSPSSDRLCAAGEFYLWNVVNTPQGLYYATANPGRVYRRGVDGKSQLVLDTGLFGVRGLAADAQGNVYAGTWPGGRVHKLTPDGKSSLLAQLDTQYIWSLAFRSDGKLVAGTGPDGRVYEIDSAGQTTQLAELPQAHVLSVLPVGERLYLATAGRGLVYSLSATGDLRALMDAEDDDVTALTTDGQGAVYAGTGTNGRIYKLAEGLAPELLFDEKTLPVYALLWQDRLLAATGGEGKLVALNADHSYDVLQDTEATHLLCLAPGPPGTVCVGSANAAALHQLALSGAAAGSFTSSVLDAKRRARWGKIDWLATVPAGTELSVQTRSGNSANAQDGTWSAWSAPYGQPGSDAVTSPAARYLQYRVQMKRAAGADTPLLRRVSIGYLPANQRPTGEFEASVATLPLKATAKLTWTASDDDKDTLLATLQYRRTGTDKWELLTELPADKKTCDWDTSKLKDGLYDLRLGVSDEPSNPGGALTAEHLLHAVRVDNARPELRLQRLQEHDGKLLVEGLASDNDALAEVACQVKEQWRGVEAVDGLFDGQYEQFRLALPLQEGKLKAKLRVRDRAGNVLEHELVWPQP